MMMGTWKTVMDVVMCERQNHTGYVQEVVEAYRTADKNQWTTMRDLLLHYQ